MVTGLQEAAGNALDGRAPQQSSTYKLPQCTHNVLNRAPNCLYEVGQQPGVNLRNATQHRARVHNSIISMRISDVTNTHFAV